MITFGSPGTRKSYLGELTVLYALSLGLNTITTSLMGVCVNALGGKHIHKLFLISTDDNLASSPFKCAETALLKIRRNTKILHTLLTLDVLFIDEIHRLSPNIEEILYPAMEDLQLDLIIGEGPSARTIKIDLPPFTLVGATTRSGLLTTPLRDRFGIQIRMEFYNSQDLVKILLKLPLGCQQKCSKLSQLDEIQTRVHFGGISKVFRAGIYKKL